MHLADYTAKDQALLATLSMFVDGKPLANITLSLLRTRGWMVFTDIGDDVCVFALTPLGIRELVLYRRVCESEADADR